jgi:hypothetical protein
MSNSVNPNEATTGAAYTSISRGGIDRNRNERELISISMKRSTVSDLVETNFRDNKEILLISTRSPEFSFLNTRLRLVGLRLSHFPCHAISISSYYSIKAPLFFGYESVSGFTCMSLREIARLPKFYSVWARRGNV